MQKHAKACQVMQSHAKSGTEFVCDMQSWCLTSSLASSFSPPLWQVSFFIRIFCNTCVSLKALLSEKNGIALENSSKTQMLTFFSFVQNSAFLTFSLYYSLINKLIIETSCGLTQNASKAFTSAFYSSCSYQRWYQLEGPNQAPATVVIGDNV
jgi:hypothetical protein